jgi:hypothetical protein
MATGGKRIRLTFEPSLLKSKYQCEGLQNSWFQLEDGVTDLTMVAAEVRTPPNLCIGFVARTSVQPFRVKSKPIIEASFSKQSISQRVKACRGWKASRGRLMSCKLTYCEPDYASTTQLRGVEARLHSVERTVQRPAFVLRIEICFG